ncbi:MAG TPA: HAMP domain-containing sensor histidine kinase [Vicinamibacterales bacterium]|nr:HAMP domain-containing sensor histidine kinase [Vicinamibacterales bacterium]
MPMASNDSYPKLLSLAVHELRTPASVVGGYLRMLQRDDDSPLNERQRKMISEAEKSCARLVQLVAELSDVSKLDAGLIALARQPLDAFALAEEVAGGVHEAEDREVRLEVRGASAGAPITGDAGRLRTAFHSIFRAILREQPAAGVVVADCRRELDGTAGRAVIVVARSEYVQAAYSAPASDFDDKRGGLGLLLPIARRVIEANGGRITSPVEPENADTAAGRGAAVITFPLRS